MSIRKEMLMKNTEFVGYCDLDSKMAFQMAMQKVEDRYYMYTSCYRHNGCNIIDVTDPANPQYLNWHEGPWFFDGVRDGQATLKIQVADGLMITAHGALISFLVGTDPDLPSWGGIIIWDVKTDPVHPKMLGKFQTSGAPHGVHRFFYNGGRYVYLTACEEGFASYIFKIIDIQDPCNPVEVSSWHSPRQTPAAEVKFGAHLAVPFVHAITVKDDIAYLAYANIGFVLLDVKDKANPKLLGEVPLNPPFSQGASGAPVHTAMPLGDRPYAVVSTEGRRSRYFSGKTEEGIFRNIHTQAMDMMGVIEMVDVNNPKLISIFPYPEMPEGYTHGSNFNFVDGVRTAFGPHNLFDAFGPDVYKKIDNKVFCCYFHAGLRIYDVSDPFVPKEIAYFFPPDPETVHFDNKTGDLMPGAPAALVEDVLVDDRGYIYLTTMHDGIYIVKYTGEDGL